MGWPSDRILTHVFGSGPAEVIRTPLGNGRGARSSDPWVYAIGGPRPFVYCERCGAHERLPDPPASGPPGEQRRSLLAPGTRAHAVFALTHLNRFSRIHSLCVEGKPPEDCRRSGVHRAARARPCSADGSPCACGCSADGKFCPDATFEGEKFR